MSLDYRIEKEANHICHMVEENEKIQQLSDKSRYDIFATCEHLANYWKSKLDEMRKENYEKKFNELTIWLNANPSATIEDIKFIMSELKDGVYIRTYRVEKDYYKSIDKCNKL